MLRLAFTDLKNTRRMLKITGWLTISLALMSICLTSPGAPGKQEMLPLFAGWIQTGSLFSCLTTLVLPMAVLTAWFFGRYLYLRGFKN